ncbi:hypothetical protein N7461_000160 [Penicillium sp. DV-2018c]|nr:hypothetical protein N7461_000160 [Penicillium sp. DV-2018c]
MPLHLLGKKSWNVYNAENIERVRRDEAQAKAREEENDRLMQEVDAERRIKILRGERPPTPPPPPHSHLPNVDLDLTESPTTPEMMLASRKTDAAQAPITDEAGHINLFPAASAKTEKNREAEAESARKKRSYEDQYTMRFSNAAGFKESVGKSPWYSSADQTATAPGAMPEKDVWGNEDPRRKERVQARMSANDPLAAIKRGVRQLRTTEQERKRWNDEKRREIEALKAEEARQTSRRRRRSTSVGSLDGSSLDAPDRAREKGRRSSGRPHRRHRDRSRDRSHHRSHHSSSHRSHRHRHDERTTTSGRPERPDAKKHS